MMKITLQDKLHQQMGYALHKERVEQQKLLTSVAQRVHMPLQVVDEIEMGVLGISYRKHIELAKYYGKRFKFTLVDREKPKQ